MRFFIFNVVSHVLLEFYRDPGLRGWVFGKRGSLMSMKNIRGGPEFKKLHTGRRCWMNGRNVCVKQSTKVFMVYTKNKWRVEVKSAENGISWEKGNDKYKCTILHLLFLCLISLVFFFLNAISVKGHTGKAKWLWLWADGPLHSKREVQFCS